VKVDGKILANKAIPLIDDGIEHKVIVLMGERIPPDDLSKD
jgi:hypothetical protein